MIVNFFCRQTELRIHTIPNQFLPRRQRQRDALHCHPVNVALPVFPLPPHERVRPSAHVLIVNESAGRCLGRIHIRQTVWHSNSLPIPRYVAIAVELQIMIKTFARNHAWRSGDLHNIRFTRFEQLKRIQWQLIADCHFEQMRVLGYSSIDYSQSSSRLNTR